MSAGSQPDWYVGWLEGSLRLFPPFEPIILGLTVPNPFFGGALLGLIILAGLYLYPFAEQWVTGDREVHHVLDLPSRRPGRTAIGAGFITFCVVLTVAGSNDVIAVLFGTQVESLRAVLRILVIVLPLVVAGLTYLACRRISRTQRVEAET